MSIQELKYSSQVIFDAACTAVQSSMNDAKKFVVNHMPRTCSPVPVWLHDIVQDLGNPGRRTVPRTAAPASICITSIKNFAATARREITSFFRNCMGKQEHKLQPYQYVAYANDNDEKDLFTITLEPPSFKELLKKHFVSLELEPQTEPFIDARQDLPPAFDKALDDFFTPSAQPVLHAKNLYEIAITVNSDDQEQRAHGLGLFKRAISNAGPAGVLIEELDDLKNSESTSADATKLLETRIGTYANLEGETTKDLLFGDINNKPPLDCSGLRFDEKTILDLLSKLQHVNNHTRHDDEYRLNLNDADIQQEHEPV